MGLAQAAHRPLNGLANNTYCQAIDQVQVDWSIIEIEGPAEWEHSFCFPNCHDIGVTEGNNTFTASSEQYLNCHVYPNGVAGEGIARMLLTTNAAAQDTVTAHNEVLLRQRIVSL